VADVEKKMKSNCFGENNERRHASDSTWIQKTTDGQGMQLSGSSAEAQGKRKILEFLNGGGELIKKGRMIGRKVFKSTSVVSQDNKHGSGVAARRPQ
jgi:hypothetical protein